MVEVGTIGGVGLVFKTGMFAMFLMYMIFFIVGTPVLWLVGRFFKLTMFLSLLGVTIVTSLVFIPFSFIVVENFSEYNEHIFNVYTFIGLMLGMFLYAFTFFKLRKK